MKKIIIASAMLVALIFVACKDNENKSQATSASQSNDSLKVEYTCPMHPEVVSDTPGVCPSCGMTLEIKS